MACITHVSTRPLARKAWLSVRASFVVTRLTSSTAPTPEWSRALTPPLPPGVVDRPRASPSQLPLLTS
eukprot:6062467-Alexandrium_andersonii.AAC.1